MNLDGSDPRQLTRLGAMSWAPFYHPSGEYLIFTTNRHGFANFELYLVDVAGQREPVRATYTKGFDGLPAFTPDGQRLAWTSNRTSSRPVADLPGGLEPCRRRGNCWAWTRPPAASAWRIPTSAVDAAAGGIHRTTSRRLRSAGHPAARRLPLPAGAGRPPDRHRRRTAGHGLRGRLPGQPGPAAGRRRRTWFQAFEFTSGVALGKENSLAWGDRQYEVDKDWLPVSFSKTGPVEPAPVVFAGYGIAAPKDDGQDGIRFVRPPGRGGQVAAGVPLPAGAGLGRTPPAPGALCQPAVQGDAGPRQRAPGA